MKTEKQKSKCMRDYLMAGAHKSKVRVLETGKKMKELLPDAGIFMNHGAYDEKDWANLGFGKKLYAELVRTKSEYDPDNIIRYHHAPRSDGKNAVEASVVSVKDDNGWRALIREAGATYAQDTWKKVDELEAGLLQAARAMMCEFANFTGCFLKPVKMCCEEVLRGGPGRAAAAEESVKMTTKVEASKGSGGDRLKKM